MNIIIHALCVCGVQKPRVLEIKDNLTVFNAFAKPSCLAKKHHRLVLMIIVLWGYLYPTLTHASQASQDYWQHAIGPQPLPTMFNLSPNDVSQLLSDVDKREAAFFPETPLTRFFRRWRLFTALINQETGLNVGMAYTGLYQYTPKGDPKKNASGGDFDIFGQWTFNQQEATRSILGFNLEQRHAYGKVAPAELNEMIESLVRTTRGFNRLDFSLTQFWWEQQVFKRHAGFRVGKIDITSLMNNYAFESQDFYFLNDAFTGHPAWAEPDNSLGFVTGVGLSKHVYAQFGLINNNGKKSTGGFNTFRKGEFFTAVELGIRSELRNPDDDNYHIFLWHTDARPEEHLPSDAGLSIVLQNNIKEKYIPFFKFDINQGRAAKFKQIVLGGIGIYQPFGEVYGLMGMAAAYAVPAHDAHGVQTITEVFYRIQLTPFVQITPDLQLIKTNLVVQGSRWDAVFSFRLRVAA